MTTATKFFEGISTRSLSGATKVSVSAVVPVVGDVESSSTRKLFIVAKRRVSARKAFASSARAGVGTARAAADASEATSATAAVRRRGAGMRFSGMVG